MMKLRRRVWLVVILTLLAGLGAAGLGEAPSAAAATPAGSGKILFEGWGGCVVGGVPGGPCDQSLDANTLSYDIWTVEPDGSGLSNLTAAPGVDADGKWSPDGEKIVFISNRSGSYQLFVMNANGEGLVQLTDDPREPVSYPTWSPDGKRIAYIATIGRRDVVRVIRPDGTRSRTIARFQYALELDWSPDGKKIALSIRGADENFRVFLMRSDGTHIRRFPGTGPSAGSPTWSPNGRRIAFDRCAGGDPCNMDIYTVRLDGTGRKRITTSPSFEYDPVWSPDGKSIAYSGEGDEVHYADIWIAHLDGRPSISVPKPDTYDYQPDWQPLFD